ncbi:hypothetical protein IAU59_007634 [Kwoniella sp. CBS 9459]
MGGGEGAKVVALALGLKGRDLEKRVSALSFQYHSTAKENSFMASLKVKYQAAGGTQRMNMFWTEAAKIFKQVTKLSIGRGLLSPDDFWPDNKWKPLDANGTPLAHPFIGTILSRLEPKHLCVIELGCYDNGDSSLMTYLSEMAQYWKLESMTWHAINPRQDTPPLPQGLLLGRIFLHSTICFYFDRGPHKACPGSCDFLLSVLDSSHSQARTSRVREPQAILKPHVELINPIWYNALPADKISKEGHIIDGHDEQTVRHTATGSHTISIPGHNGAEPCVCSLFFPTPRQPPASVQSPLSNINHPVCPT